LVVCICYHQIVHKDYVQMKLNQSVEQMGERIKMIAFWLLQLAELKGKSQKLVTVDVVVKTNALKLTVVPGEHADGIR